MSDNDGSGGIFDSWFKDLARMDNVGGEAANGNNLIMDELVTTIEVKAA